MPDKLSRGAVIALLSLGAWPTGAALQAGAGDAPGAQVARASRCDAPIRIDGVLDEPCWATAGPLTSFTQRLPAEGAPATQATEVRVLFDAENLYVGADLLDSDPGRIIALEMKEDGALNNDDLFGILLDTFHDRRNAFYFEVNPNGARADALLYDEGRVQSWDWDGVWEAQGTIGGRGWTVEMQIPFKTLHFDPGRTDPWGLQAWRYIRRNTEDVFWGPVPRNEDPLRVSRAGTLAGLEGIRQGKSLALKPYALGGALRQPTLGGTGTERKGEPGLDARYDVTPNLGAVLTLNTDFAETEVDDQQINTTRFPLFFPEKREFFLESTGFFEFGYNRTGPGAPPGLLPFFSRRIGLSASSLPVPIVGGAKLAGRIGRTNLGFLSVFADEAEGRPRTNFTVLRLSRDFLARSNFGILGISKEPAGPDDPVDPADLSAGVHSNRTYGADLNLSVLENFKLGGSILQTRTPGIEASQGAGHAYATWSSNAWELFLSHRDIGSGFNPEAGFVQRTGIEESEGFVG
ncbi:MAG: carbohydrate binding family 9 domain-containing protein, partial [Acidobacteria bacterium]|nr:carbohydrate binding family 9 domain-containing protein [Acidobacteriota bacterium]